MVNTHGRSLEYNYFHPVLSIPWTVSENVRTYFNWLFRTSHCSCHCLNLHRQGVLSCSLTLGFTNFGQGMLRDMMEPNVWKAPVQLNLLFCIFALSWEKHTLLSLLVWGRWETHRANPVQSVAWSCPTEASVNLICHWDTQGCCYSVLLWWWLADTPTVCQSRRRQWMSQA